MEWDKVEIIIPIEIGELTQKKRDTIQEVFKAVGEIEGDEETIVIRNSTAPEILIFSSKAISYINVIGNVSDTKLLGQIKSIVSRFLLEDENEVQIRLNVIAEHSEPMNVSKDQFNSKNNSILDTYPSITGVGYRFFIENTKGEIRIEPYIKEENKIFIEYVKREKCNIDKLAEYIGISMEIIENMYRELSKKIF